MGYATRVLVVSYSISTSNHNFRIGSVVVLTVVSYSISTSNHNSTLARLRSCALCLILFLHQTTTIEQYKGKAWCCVLFYFYIKPQLLFINAIVNHSCVLFYFYIKPQQKSMLVNTFRSCVLFYFYIKPQPSSALRLWSIVVSYSISTSNHNLIQHLLASCNVVSYSISTSNHN